MTDIAQTMQGKKPLAIASSIAALIIAIAARQGIQNSREEPQSAKGVVRGMVPYSHADGKGYIVCLEGLHGSVKIPINRWDETVNQGDPVCLTYRRHHSFVDPPYRALSIMDNK